MCASCVVVSSIMGTPWVLSIGKDVCLFLIVETALLLATMMKLQLWEDATYAESPAKMCGIATTTAAIAPWWPAESVCSPWRAVVVPWMDFSFMWLSHHIITVYFYIICKGFSAGSFRSESLLITSFRWLVFSNHTSHFSSRWDFWRKVPIARILRPFAHLMRTVERDVALVFSYLLPRSKLRTRGGAMTNFAALAWARSTFLMSQSVFFFNCGPRGWSFYLSLVYHAYLLVTCFNPHFVTVSFFMLLIVWWPGTPCRPGGVWYKQKCREKGRTKKREVIPVHLNTADHDKNDDLDHHQKSSKAICGESSSFFTVWQQKALAAIIGKNTNAGYLFA